MTIRNLHALLEKLSGEIVPVDVIWGRYYEGGESAEINRMFVCHKERADSFETAVKSHISGVIKRNSCSQRERMKLLSVEWGGKKHPLVWLDAPDRQQGACIFIAVPLTLGSTKKFFETFIWLESVMDKTSSLCCLIDRNGNFIRLSRKGCEILGLEKERLRDRNLEEFLLSPSRLSDLSILSQRKENTEIYLRNYKDEEILFIGSIIPFFDGNNEVLYYYIVVTDFSHQINLFSSTVRDNMELSNMNDFLKKSQTALLKAEKLSSIGMLGSGLAHEMNNPLSFVINDIQLLEEFCSEFRGFTDKLEPLRERVPELGEVYKAHDMDYYIKEIPEMLSEMKEGMERIQKIIGSLKSFSGLENSSEWNYADVNKLLEEMLIISRNEYKYDVELEFLPGKVPQVYCHVKELNQAFLSVFLNSIQAVQEQWGDEGKKGRIIIRTAYDRETESVSICFSDNGCPFPDSIGGKLLDPFYTQWKKKKGSGLGLALVNDIISHKHKGDVYFEEEEEKQIILTIPVNIRETQGD